MKFALLIFAASLCWAASAVKIVSLTCPIALAPGQSGFCFVTITKPAPKGGAVFRITLKGMGLTAPMLVTVPKGATSTTFQIVRPILSGQA